ncbi:hypothetical protein B4096_2183 [Heyndrickxia coagulans]|nr:hypothetical protein B4096_2183 [Heyndrickxia coagulans]
MARFRTIRLVSGKISVLRGMHPCASYPVVAGSLIGVRFLYGKVDRSIPHTIL